MPNMSYCRFQNTVGDLEDCEEHIRDDLQDKEEKNARTRLIKICKGIAEEFEDD